MKPDFSKIDYKPRAAARPAHTAEESAAIWMTAERIPVKPCYTADDLYAMEHLEYAAGIAPFLRGPYSTMYAMQPWTIRQYAGFFHSGGIERLLSPESRGGSERPVGGIRPGDAPRLRLR